MKKENSWKEPKDSFRENLKNMKNYFLTMIS